MKIKKFKVDIFDWDIAFIKLNKRDKANDVIDVFKDMKISNDEIEKYLKETIDEDGQFDGGDHFWNAPKRVSIIVLYPIVNLNKNDVICHEKRHVEDRILEHCGVEDIETAAYLAGFLGKELL